MRGLVATLRTHQGIQSTGRIFEGLLSKLYEVFLENSLQRFVSVIFTLLLVPFVSHKGSDYRPVLLKRYQKKHHLMDLKSL